MPKPLKKKASDIKKLPMVFQIDLQKFAEAGKAPTEIQVLPIGQWNHPSYGLVKITSEDIAEFKQNFDKGLRKQIPITEGHEGFDEKPAVGWFVELHDRGGNGLYATIEWTKEGKTLLSEKSYKYFSPEFYSEYEDPQTRDIHTNVLVGGALTNKPYFKELEAVVMSETIIKNNKLNFNDMNLKDILAKKVEDLSTEEKTFLQENKSELNDDQLATFGSVFEDEKKELTDEEKKANVDAGKNEDGSEKTAELTDEEKKANVDAGKNEDGSEKTEEKKEEKTEEKTEEENKEDEPVNASEFKTDGKGNVVMSLSEATALSVGANKGYKASEDLRKNAIKLVSDKLVFSEQNSKGKILPKHEAKVFSFMLGLTEAQRKTFAELVEAIPMSKLFGEKGSAASAGGSAFSEIETKVKKIMSEDKEIKYSAAITRVCSENKELSDRYALEIAGK